MALLHLRFVWRIVHHKWWVFLYGIKIGGIPLWRLIIHDWSKFSRAEFNPRFHYQILKVITFESDEFKAVCNHHHARNPHHWQYWVRDGVPMPMPETYVREMVVDWLAADRTYREGLPNWLRKEFPAMNLHKKTSALLIRILASQGVAPPEWLPSARTAV